MLQMRCAQVHLVRSLLRGIGHLLSEYAALQQCHEPLVPSVLLEPLEVLAALVLLGAVYFQKGGLDLNLIEHVAYHVSANAALDAMDWHVLHVEHHVWVHVVLDETDWHVHRVVHQAYEGAVPYEFYLIPFSTSESDVEAARYVA